MARESNLPKDNKSLYLSEVNNPLVLIHRNIILNEHINEKTPVANGDMPAFPFQGIEYAAQEENLIDNSIYNDLPFEMPVVEQPTFPDYEVNIVAYGAKNDGKFLNTEAINNAIKAVNAKGRRKSNYSGRIVADRPYRTLEQCKLIYRA